MSDVTVTVTRSAGEDRAVLIFIDTGFDPDGSDDGPGVRVRLNDHAIYAGKPFTPYPDDKGDADAGSVYLEADLEQIAYTGTFTL